MANDEKGATRHQATLLHAVGLPLRRFVLPKGNELPSSFGYRRAMAEDVEIVIVGTNLEEDVLWTVPLVVFGTPRRFQIA